MREIKFRAWDKEDEVMILHDELSNRNSIMDFYSNYINPYAEMTGVYDSPRIYMQYTGLKDKNGTEIYEGDICYDDHMNVRGKVVYTEGMFLYEWENIANTLFEVTKDIEVIGNIYENSKLLEVTE